MSKKSKRVSPQDQLFNDPHHGAYRIRNSVGILAQLYRLIIAEIGIDKRTWERYLNDYIRRFAREHPDRSPNAERGNVRKALTKPWMSWKTLLRALIFAKFKHVRIIIEGELESGRVIRVESQRIDLSDPIAPMTEGESDEVDATEPKYHVISRDPKNVKGTK